MTSQFSMTAHSHDWVMASPALLVMAGHGWWLESHASHDLVNDRQHNTDGIIMCLSNHLTDSKHFIPTCHRLAYHPCALPRVGINQKR
jgi:hypothetical protein